jgi:hypothetical protein
MEDISTLIWIGIAILWVLTRLIRRGARKAARQAETRPAAREAKMPTFSRDPSGAPIGPSSRSTDSGTTAKPIEPR